MTVPVVVLLVIAAGYAAKHKNADSPGIFLGVCIGVMGAEGIIGETVRSLMVALTEAGTSVTQSLEVL